MLSRSHFRHGFTLVGMLLTTQVQAQGGPGWSICWGGGCGASSVPLSPWLSVLVSLFLAAVAFVLIRRRSKGLAGLVALGFVLAGLSGYEMQKAWARSPDFDITSPSGNEFVACGAYSELYADNSSGQSVTIRVSPVGGVGSLPHMPNDCRDLSVLPNGAQCDLPCLEPG